MAIKYPSLFNANISAAMAGMFSGRGATDPVSADYAAVTAAAVAFATEYDTLLTNTVLPGFFAQLISAVGVTQVPATAGEANAAESLPVAVAVFTKAAFEGRVSVDSTVADYTAIAGVLLNQVLAAVTGFLTT
jgi:hypothetical protein